jgi:CubicO group peptidase (beta-lactamase class C family)
MHSVEARLSPQVSAPSSRVDHALSGDSPVDAVERNAIARRSGSQYASPVLDVTVAQLLARSAQAQVDGRLPSLAVGVVQDGALAWTCGRGAIDGAEPSPAMQYRIGSITKTFVAVQIMQLRDTGRFSLGTTVDELVPGTPVGDRTVGQLLGHVSGLRAETTGDWWERTPGRQWSELVEPLGAEAVPFPAGRRFHYSNVGFAVLGEVVSRIRGLPWAEALRRDVLDPLGMKRTWPTAAPPAAHGLAVHPWAPVVLTEPAHDYAAMAPAGQLPEDIELDLLGPWYWGPNPFALHAGADGLLHLHNLAGADEAVHFRALGDGRWVGLNDYYAGEVLTVGRDASGRATQLDIGSFSFSRTAYDPAADPPGGVDEAGWH